MNSSWSKGSASFQMGVVKLQRNLIKDVASVALKDATRVAPQVQYVEHLAPHTPQPRRYFQTVVR